MAFFIACFLAFCSPNSACFLILPSVCAALVFRRRTALRPLSVDKRRGNPFSKIHLHSVAGKPQSINLVVVGQNPCSLRRKTFSPDISTVFRVPMRESGCHLRLFCSSATGGEKFQGPNWQSKYLYRKLLAGGPNSTAKAAHSCPCICRAGKQHILEHDPLDSGSLMNRRIKACRREYRRSSVRSFPSSSANPVPLWWRGGWSRLQNLLAFEQSPSCVRADVYAQRHKSLRMLTRERTLPARFVPVFDSCKSNVFPGR